jgi:para-aminobenzoate synthetase component 1
MTAKEQAIEAMNAKGRAGEPFFFLIDFDFEAPLVLGLEEARQKGFRFSTPDFPEVTSAVPSETASLTLAHEPYPLDRYCEQFEQVQQALRKGDSFLVNLTCQTPVQSTYSLNELYERAVAKYRLLWEDRFLVFSPETFVRIVDGVIASCPMKGTIDASVSDARSLLLSSVKEAAEHSTIVDLIRNDLSMVAKEVKVNRFRYVDEIETGTGRLLQVSSEITGRLPDDFRSRLGDILAALLPAGSVTGAPKPRTVEIIRTVETYARGYYTGVFGIFDGHNLDSAVLIRFLEQTPQGLCYKSGGGITAKSRMMDEYHEMRQKIYVPTA